MRAYDDALVRATDPVLRAEITMRRVTPCLQVHGPEGLSDEMLAAAADVEAVDVEQAALLSALSAVPVFASGDLRAAADAARRSAERVGGPGTLAGIVAVLVLAIARALAGDAHENGKVLIAYADALAPHVGTSDSFGSADLLAGVLTWLGEFSSASRLVSTLVDVGREQRAVGVLALALAVRSDLYFRTGHWLAARSDADESVDLARGVPGVPLAGYTQLALARMEAVAGRPDEARRRGREALRLGEEFGLGSVWYAAHGVLGFTELGELDLAAAIEHLERARSFAEREGIRLAMVVPWAPDLVEAYLRVGRTEDAVSTVARLVDEGVAEQGPLASSVLSRCQGLVASSAYEDHFQVALASHASLSLPCPFVRARTELCFGERLRRDKRAGNAAVHLRHAADTFRHLGADPVVASRDGRARGRRGLASPASFRPSARA